MTDSPPRSPETAIGIWQNVELLSPGNEFVKPGYAEVWSTATTGPVANRNVFVDVPDNTLPVESGAVVGWQFSAGPDLGTFVIEGRVDEIGGRVDRTRTLVITLADT